MLVIGLEADNSFSVAEELIRNQELAGNLEPVFRNAVPETVEARIADAAHEISAVIIGTECDFYRCERDDDGMRIRTVTANEVLSRCGVFRQALSERFYQSSMKHVATA
jgi:hypothetical protein